MAENPNLNTVQTQKASTSSTLSTRRRADALAIVFEVDQDFDKLPPSLQDLVYGEEYVVGQTMACANEGIMIIYDQVSVPYVDLNIGTLHVKSTHTLAYHTCVSCHS